MPQLIIRATVTLASITATVVLTNIYYAQAMECLARLEKLAHAAIPAILAAYLAYEVIRIATRKRN